MFIIHAALLIEHNESCAATPDLIKFRPSERFGSEQMKRLESLAVFVCLLGVTIPGFAQSERGTITGAVHDTTGAVIPGASVKITNEATNVSLDTVTNTQGEFTAPSLPPSTYTVRVEKQGFRPSYEKGLTLVAGGNVRADATLQVGASSQAIEVQATAVQLSTEDARNSVTLENRLVQDLPLEVAGSVRGPFNLAAIAPDAKNLGTEADRHTMQKPSSDCPKASLKIVLSGTFFAHNRILPTVPPAIARAINQTNRPT